MELVSIGTRLYACLQPDRGLGWSNSGFIAAGGGLVVDTLYDQRLTARMAGLYDVVFSRCTPIGWEGGDWDDPYDTGAAMTDAATLQEQWAP